MKKIISVDYRFLGILFSTFFSVLIILIFDFFTITYLICVVFFIAINFFFSSIRFDYINYLRPRNMPIFYFLIHIVIAPGIHLIKNEYTFTSFEISSYNFNKALFVYLLAFFIYAISFKTFEKSSKTNRLNKYDLFKFKENKVRYFLIIIWIFIGIISFYSLWGGLNGFINYFENLSSRKYAFSPGTGRYMIGLSFAPVALSVLFITWINKLKMRICILILFTIYFCCIPFLSYTGSRISSFNFLIVLLMIFNRFKARISLKYFSSIIILFLLFAIIFGYVRATLTDKNIYNIDNKTKNYIHDEFSITRFIITDFSRFDVTIPLIDYIDKTNDLQLGSTFLNGFIKLLPSGLVEKDEKREGATKLLGIAIYGNSILSSYSTKASPLIGELYANFHLPGVILGYILIGWIWACLDRNYFCEKSPIDFLILANCITIFYFMFNVAWDLFFQKFIFTLLPIIFFKYSEKILIKKQNSFNT